jgi:hypothetical protein
VIALIPRLIGARHQPEVRRQLAGRGEAVDVPDRRQQAQRDDRLRRRLDLELPLDLPNAVHRTHLRKSRMDIQPVEHRPPCTLLRAVCVMGITTPPSSRSQRIRVGRRAARYHDELAAHKALGRPRDDDPPPALVRRARRSGPGATITAAPDAPRNPLRVRVTVGVEHARTTESLPPMLAGATAWSLTRASRSYLGNPSPRFSP